MHELGIAESILSAVRVEVESRPGVRPVRVGLRIGEFAAVDPASLRFCLEAITRGTNWHPLTLDIESSNGTGELEFSFLEVEDDHDHSNPDQNQSSQRESSCSGQAPPAL